MVKPFIECEMYPKCKKKPKFVIVELETGKIGYFCSEKHIVEFYDEK